MGADTPGMENVSSKRLRSAVHNFAERMSLIYLHDDQRREEGLDYLDAIFSACNDSVAFPVMATNVSKSSSSDGPFFGPHRVACCITAFRNESGCSLAIPYVEITNYFAHSMRKAAEHFDSVSVMGDGDDRIALYDAFTASSVLLARIQDDAAKLVHNPLPPIEASCRILPRISSLHHPHSGTPIEFKIIELFHSQAADRYLYIAETTDSKQIMIKFTRHYSYKLHMFCADRGCAPALLGFERLPGGFFGTAMEFVQFAFPVSQSPYAEKHREWTEQLWKLVESFHAEGLVHGDLRAPNIICDRNRVMLIDFDWAGEESEVSCPHMIVRLMPI
ncbi:hypothetical protein EDC04DRAFT_3148552 [Pisolithus marmoratus]|nr:hypothetical protein EDC04DRAFT_3148552 [Pisolithus marmoratus]